jgi:hypothetical protein
MKQLWQRFVEFAGEPEAAAIGLFIAALTIAGSIALAAYWTSTGRYLAAGSVAALLGGAAVVCVRDYRQRRWSFLSGLLVMAWALLTYGAIAYGVWLEFGRR